MPDSKLIVLTGATKGLGRAMADRFRDLGHRVCGCGRSRGEIDSLNTEFGPPHGFSVVDVSSQTEVDTWAESILKESGPPDFLINNAALINPNAPLWKVPREEFDHVIDVNIKGVANVLRAFVPAMIERQSGAILNFSSYWGRSTAPEVAPYCATKWAIEGLTRALAQELPKGMAAIPLNPGIINTDMLRSCFGPQASGYPTADAWAKKAVPFILSLGPSHNGKPLTAPE